MTRMKRKPPRSDVYTAQPRVMFTCPFCGVENVTATDDAVLHPIPACTKYLLLDVTDYLHEVNAALAGSS